MKNLNFRYCRTYILDNKLRKLQRKLEMLQLTEIKKTEF